MVGLFLAKPLTFLNIHHATLARSYRFLHAIEIPAATAVAVNAAIALPLLSYYSSQYGVINIVFMWFEFLSRFPMVVVVTYSNLKLGNMLEVHM